MGGWMDEWMDGWMDVFIRIILSLNHKEKLSELEPTRKVGSHRI
jgi:hypothetical protein